MSARRTAQLILAVVLAAGCGGRDTGPASKVLLIGVDGATFDLLDPLVAAGELPHFASLLGRGSRAVLDSDRPMLSPALWTTIATGHSRARHGIRSFTVPGDDGQGQIMVSSALRQTLTLWDMASVEGRSVGIVGWWATWPAEPVRGWLISDRMTRSRWSEWSDGVKQEHLTFPPELAAEMLPLVVDPEAPPLDELRRIVDLTAAEERELLAARKPLYGHDLSVFKFGFSTQLSYERMAAAMLERGQPDLTAVFLIANDPVSHTFWHHHQPEAFGLDTTDDSRRLGLAVPNMYRHNDAYLGRLLELVGPDTVTIVVSDHGFEASGTLPSEAPAGRVRQAFGVAEGEELGGVVAVGQSGKHHPDGVLIAAGPGIATGAAIRARLIDVTPTVLALLGAPVPRDLPGRVLTEILDPAFLAAHPIAEIESYEELVDRDALRVDPGVTEADESRLEMLRSLGYIE